MKRSRFAPSETMSADVPMEPSDPQEPTESQGIPEPPQATEPPPPAEPPVPTSPKRKQRKPRVTVVTAADPLVQEVPSREPKRPNRRTQTPPTIAVDQTFWSGLLATQRAMRRESKAQRYSNLAIV